MVSRNAKDGRARSSCLVVVATGDHEFVDVVRKGLDVDRRSLGRLAMGLDVTSHLANFQNVGIEARNTTPAARSITCHVPRLSITGSSGLKSTATATIVQSQPGCCLRENA